MSRLMRHQPHWTCTEKELEFRFFQSGADTNLAMEDGRTGLHISAESGNVAVLRQLLENGADPTLEDKVGAVVPES